jgi:hypothetical protein
MNFNPLTEKGLTKPTVNEMDATVLEAARMELWKMVEYRFNP